MSRSIDEILKDMEPLQKKLDQLSKEILKADIKRNEAWYRRFRPEVFIEKDKENEQRDKDRT